MKKIKFLLFVLLALLYVSNANALIKNDTFTRDGNTYMVTEMIPGTVPGTTKTYNGSVLKPSCKPTLLSA